MVDEPTQKLIDLGGNVVGLGTGWEKSAVSYPVGGHKPDSVETFTDLLWLSGQIGSPFSFNMKVGSDKNLYLFTVSGDTYAFTFDLLFVKTFNKGEVDESKWSVTVNNAYYSHSSGHSGSILAGTGYWTVDPELATDAIASLTKLEAGDTLDIYMVVHKYGGLTFTGRNVIKIK